jgi:hypothetical protein
MLDNIVHWFRYSDLLEKAITLAIIFIAIMLIVALIDPGNTTADRKTFCLDRGYDKYETSQGNFYCKNSGTGEIKKFSDPTKSKSEPKKRSWE